MNKLERIGGEAKLEYLDSSIRIASPGHFVLCAVTGKQIALDQLRYWSVERQEPYSSPAAVMERMSSLSNGTSEK